MIFVSIAVLVLKIWNEGGLSLEIRSSPTRKYRKIIPYACCFIIIVIIIIIIISSIDVLTNKLVLFSAMEH